jgi:CubicO group peptidase (beta-lactamase class C family)
MEARRHEWDYCNTGYYLLGLVIERASGQSYGDFLAARIFRPLGMDTARVNHQFEIITNRATGYAFQSNRLSRSEFVSPTQPFAAGALVGTVLDLARWDAALLTDQILRADDWQEMWTPVRLNDGRTRPYGYGFQTGDVRGHPFVGHGGGIHGFTSFILRLVRDKLTVIVLINTGADPQGIAVGVAGQYLPGLTPGSMKAQPDADSPLTGRLKQCLLDLAAKKDSEMLTEGFRRNFARSQRRHATLQEDVKTWKTFTFILEEKPAADPREVDGVPVERVRRYRLKTGDGPRYYSFSLTAHNQVALVQATDE